MARSSLLFSLSVVAALAAQEGALLPPNPSKTQAMQSIIDSLLAKSRERRQRHEQLMALEDGGGLAEEQDTPTPESTLPDFGQAGVGYPYDLPKEAKLAPAEKAGVPPPIVGGPPDVVPVVVQGPIASDLAKAEAKVSRLSAEVMRLRGMTANCSDGEGGGMGAGGGGGMGAGAGAGGGGGGWFVPTPTPEPCPNWVDDLRIAIHKLDKCQAELEALLAQLREREALRDRLKYNPTNVTLPPGLGSDGSRPCANTTVTIERIVYVGQPAPEGSAAAVSNEVATVAAAAAPARASVTTHSGDGVTTITIPPTSAALAAASRGSSGVSMLASGGPAAATDDALASRVDASVRRAWMQDPKQPASARAEALVAAMGRDEQLRLATARGGDGAADDAALAAGGGRPRVYAGVVAANAQLGVPELRLAEGASGFASDGVCAAGTVTQWPSGLAVAATWDPQAAASWGAALGEETRRKGAGVLLGPRLDLVGSTTPSTGGAARGGADGARYDAERLSGEDPVLGATLAPAAVRGIQSQGVIAAARGFGAAPPADSAVSSAVGGAAGGGAEAATAQRTLRELAYPPFAAAVGAGLGGVVCGHARLNGTAVCESPSLLLGELRGALGFGGAVLSESGATRDAAAAARAGVDLQIRGGGEGEGGGAGGGASRLIAAAHNGEVSGARAAEMATRLLTPMFSVGLFDTGSNGGGANGNPAQSQPPRETAQANVTSAEHAELARQLASAGTVLLQNKGELLPLSATSVHSLAMVGDACAPPPPPTKDGGGGVAFANYGADPRVVPARVITPLDGVRATLRDAGSAAAVSFAPTGGDGGKAAALAAAQAQVAVVCVGVGVGVAAGGNGGALELSAAEAELVRAVARLQPNVVVAAVAPGALLMPWADVAPAVLLGLMPGQEWGAALADVLFGAVSPSGKLPLTIPATAASPPASAAVGTATATATAGGAAATAVDAAAVDGALLRGYRWFDAHGATPRFAFGHGLGYSTFELSDLSLTPEADSGVTVRATLHNVGARAAAEVVQLYLGFPAAARAPPRQLKAFAKKFLQPGERNRLTFSLKAPDLSAWSVATQRLEPVAGEFAAFVGTSSRSLPLGATFVQQPSGRVSFEALTPLDGARQPAASFAPSRHDGPAAQQAAQQEQEQMVAQQQQLAVEQAFTSG